MTRLAGGASYHVLLFTAAPTRLNRQSTTIFGALGHTTVLLVLALALVVVLSVALGLVAASRRGSAVDVTLHALSYLAWAVPAFLLALLVQALANSIGGTRGIGPFPLAGWPGSCPTGLGVNTEFPVDFGSIDTYSIEPVLLLTAVLVIVSSIGRRNDGRGGSRAGTGR